MSLMWLGGVAPNQALRPKPRKSSKPGANLKLQPYDPDMPETPNPKPAL